MVGSPERGELASKRAQQRLPPDLTRPELTRPDLTRPDLTPTRNLTLNSLLK